MNTVRRLRRVSEYKEVYLEIHKRINKILSYRINNVLVERLFH